MYFLLMGEWNLPGIESHGRLFILGGRHFNPSKGKHVLKGAESHHCEVNTLRILACNF